jgi:hypothetical protein
VQIVLEFAQREGETIGLRASNLERILPSLVEWNAGRSNAILDMPKGSKLLQHRAEDQIKAHILYVNYRVGWRDSRTKVGLSPKAVYSSQRDIH